MENAKRIRDDILEAVRDHPFLSRRQLELYLGRPGRTVRKGLAELKTRNWVWQANARQPDIHTRSLFALTKEGIEELAQRMNIPPREFGAQIGYHAERLGRIVLTMERVFQLRTFFLWLAGPETGSKREKQKRPNASEDWRWRATAWDVEVGKLFSAKGRGVWIPFHGAALMQRGDNRWAFVVVELDLRRVPVERDRERLHEFVTAQDDPRYWGKDKEQFFPVLLVIAQDELRLQDYYNVLRSAALTRQLPMPRAYLTTFDAMLTLRHASRNPFPIWFSTISGRRTSLLFDTQGIAAPLPERVPWRQLPLNQVGRDGNIGATPALAPQGGALLCDASVTSESLPSNAAAQESTNTLAQIALNMAPIEKRILDEIAAHPLLTRNEIVLLLQVSLRRVQPAIAKLTLSKLIESIEHPENKAHRVRYLLAPKGEKYLALTAGFGHAVRRYARARGWGKGFDSLVRHWEHTKAENKFFLHLAALARDWGHNLTWLSELESRLYYEAGQRRHSFLPDGRGSYSARDARYEFAVEIDRSRSPQARFRRKLAEYEACVSSNVLRSEGVEFLRVLVMTNSWERAETWHRAAVAVRASFPMFITTFDRLYASGADAPIWMRGDATGSGQTAAASPKGHCFEYFREGKKPRYRK